MKRELIAEASSESESYDKMVCWCESNEKAKTKAVKDADVKDTALESDIQSRSARLAELSTQISQLKAQLATDKESLRIAASLREREAAVASSGETSLEQAVANLRNAIAVLSKHRGNLLQLGTPLVSSLQVLLRDVGARYSAFAAGGAGLGAEAEPPQMSLLALGRTVQRIADQEPDAGIEDGLLGALAGSSGDLPDVPLGMAAHLVAKSARAPRGTATRGVLLQVVDEGRSETPPARSGEILGVLKRLLEEFEAQLRGTKEDEGKSSDRHQALADAKRQQIDVAKQKLDDFEADAAANHKALSDAKEDLASTRKRRAADVEFLQRLKLSCNDLDADWERRSKTRSEETKAVAEAISILAEDASREALSRSISLLQQRAGAGVGAAARRARAAAALRRAAADESLDMDDLLDGWRGRHDPPQRPAPSGGARVRLAALALAARSGPLAKVQETMDNMVAQLKDQQKEEVKLKAYCGKEFELNEKASFKKGDEKGELESELASLSGTAKMLKQEIAGAKAQISETKDAIKKASGIREKENAEFQTTVADQRATRTILKKALLRLRSFYDDGSSGVDLFGQAPRPAFDFLQQAASQSPPGLLPGYGPNAGAAPVMALLEQILEDSRKLEAEAVAGETRAQADYQSFVKDSSALVDQLKDAVAQKTRAAADVRLEVAETESSLESARTELDSLAAYEADLHDQCDFVLRNFDTRQRARLQEVEAIQSAKAILSGSAAA